MKTAALLSLVAVVSAQDGRWEAITPGGETNCVDGAPFSFFIKRGARDKVNIDFAGGGACWDAGSCLLPIYTRNVNVQGTINSLNGMGAGINSATNPANPLIEWTQVHVPYCTADAHAGNNTIDYGYGEFNHVGRVNSQAAIDWIVQNYGSSAKTVSVSGCSAGALGGLVNAPFLFEEFDDDVLKVFNGDSYVGVLAQGQYEAVFDTWGLRFAPFIEALSYENIKTWTRDVGAVITAASANYFADKNSVWTAFSFNADAVQGAFYALGGGTEAWTPLLRLVTGESDAKTTNYHSFIAPGAAHCTTNLNSFYSTRADGVSLADWFTNLVNGRPIENVDCLGNGC